MSPVFIREKGHMSGWTDDLGIIADQNTWVQGKWEGWYWYIGDLDLQAVRKSKALLDELLASEVSLAVTTKSRGWVSRHYVYLMKEEDVLWFNLMW